MSFYYWQKAIHPKQCQDIIDEFDDVDELQADTGMYQGRESLFPEEIRRYKEEDMWDYEIDAPKEGVLSEIRETKLNWMDNHHPMNKILLDYVLETNKKVWHYALEKFTPCQFGKYEVGGFYGWHQDSGYSWAETEQETRKLSLTLQLSNPDDYEGGEFQFWSGNSDPETPPIQSQGSILVFDSRLWHQVTPVTKGIRYSLVSWILGPPFV
jgi:PKHD-type hydroxylase